MRFRRLKLQLQTSDGPYGFTTDFPDGLVVFWADNTMGKSTCVRSILVALGMEAMLTTSQNDLPLPPAMKSRLMFPQGTEHNILQSEVFLEIENSKKERIVIHRTIVGERDKNLVTVYEGPALTAPDLATTSRDYFVSRAGAATRELGFHHYLAKFLGWSLPTVQTYDASEVPLYLQCIFPYFVVEQTRGWSTVQPPLPSQFRIRDPNKRAVEFLLGLDAHKVALKRQELANERASIEQAWDGLVARLNELALRIGGKVQSMPQKPVAAWPPVVLPSIIVASADGWRNLSERLAERSKEHKILVQKQIPRVEEIKTEAQAELSKSESRLRDRQSLHARLLETLSLEVDEMDEVKNRIDALDEDIQRHKDLRTLKRLGSQQGSAIEKEECPICHQAIHDSLVPLASEQTVMTLDQNIDFLSEQKRTYEMVLKNAERALEARKLQVENVQIEVSQLRDEVRALRQTLISDGNAPSLAAVQARVRLENSIRDDASTIEQFSSLLGPAEELTRRWETLQGELSKMPANDVSEADKNKLASWTQIVRSQLMQYEFKSFSVDQITISTDTYRPEHEGFDLQTSISASDLIRTIWACLQGLLELSRSVQTNHPGCVVFDEPRQQSAKEVSFKELLKRSSKSKEAGQQVIFFTSESIEKLNQHLQGLDHSLIKVDGQVLKKFS